MISANIIPYEGDDPFIFVSYAHDDAERVLPILEKLNDISESVQTLKLWLEQKKLEG